MNRWVGVLFLGLLAGGCSSSSSSADGGNPDSGTVGGGLGSASMTGNDAFAANSVFYDFPGRLSDGGVDFSSATLTFTEDALNGCNDTLSGQRSNAFFDFANDDGTSLMPATYAALATGPSVNSHVFVRWQLKAQDGGSSEKQLVDNHGTVTLTALGLDGGAMQGSFSFQLEDADQSHAGPITGTFSAVHCP